MSNPPLLVLNAGRGETPACDAAKFKRGDVVRVRRRKHLASIPEELVALVAVPPGFPADYALADLLGEPRPLMIQAPYRTITYILCREGDTKPYCLRESDLLPTGQAIEIGTVSRENSPAHIHDVRRSDENTVQKP